MSKNNNWAGFDVAVDTKRNKYNARKTVYNGRAYDSAKEANYRQLLDLAKKATNKAAKVTEIQEQVRYNIEVAGIKICAYVLDFKVTYATGLVRYIDVKGYKKGTAYRMFQLKKSLMKAVYNITVEEV
jgi:hypothetical protein